MNGMRVEKKKQGGRELEERKGIQRTGKIQGKRSPEKDESGGDEKRGEERKCKLTSGERKG